MQESQIAGTSVSFDYYSIRVTEYENYRETYRYSKNVKAGQSAAKI